MVNGGSFDKRVIGFLSPQEVAPLQMTFLQPIVRCGRRGASAASMLTGKYALYLPLKKKRRKERKIQSKEPRRVCGDSLWPRIAYQSREKADIMGK